MMSLTVEPVAVAAVEIAVRTRWMYLHNVGASDAQEVRTAIAQQDPNQGIHDFSRDRETYMHHHCCCSLEEREGFGV